MQLVSLVGAVGAASAALIAWLAHVGTGWGATAQEQVQRLPGDDIFGAGVTRTTNAITIHAPAAAIWPWLVQMGQGRGGFYTYTWVENLLGAHITNLDSIDPALQSLEVGDRIWLTPRTYLGRPGQAWTVVEIVPEFALVLVQKPPANPMATTWTLALLPSGAGTRLLSRHCSPRPETTAKRAVSTFWAAGDFVMGRGMLRGIKQRAEALPSAAAGR